MSEREKKAEQLALVQKGLDIAESLRRVWPVERWTLPLGGEPRITSKPKHSWKDLRLACHDLRPLYLKSDPLKCSSFSGLLGPLTRKNRRILNTGLRMMRDVALLESDKSPLKRTDIKVFRLDASNKPVEVTVSGFVHNTRSIATAYIYGQWAHGTRAKDYSELLAHYGRDAHFIILTDFVFKAGHGFLAALTAFHASYFGQELPEFAPNKNLVVDVPGTVKKLKQLAKALRSELAGLSGPEAQSTHVLPIWNAL